MVHVSLNKVWMASVVIVAESVLVEYFLLKTISEQVKKLKEKKQKVILVELILLFFLQELVVHVLLSYLSSIHEHQHQIGREDCPVLVCHDRQQLVHLLYEHLCTCLCRHKSDFLVQLLFQHNYNRRRWRKEEELRVWLITLDLLLLSVKINIKNNQKTQSKEELTNGEKGKNHLNVIDEFIESDVLSCCNHFKSSLIKQNNQIIKQNTQPIDHTLNPSKSIVRWPVALHFVKIKSTSGWRRLLSNKFES